MNRREWIHYCIAFPDEEIHELIAHSFEFTRPKKHTADHKRTAKQEL